MSPSKDPGSVSIQPSAAPPPTLPPSVEEAYKKKCIELRRRMIEVEEQNDQMRLRRTRLIRGIRKMRLERAILMDVLAKRMRKNDSGGPLGTYDEESEDSSDAPPTPQERPLRTKKSHRRTMLSPAPGASAASTQNPLLQTPIAPAPSAASPGATGNLGSSMQSSQFPASPSNSQLERPAPPQEMFQSYMLNEGIPNNLDGHPDFPTDSGASQKEYVKRLWHELPKEEVTHWHNQYEDRMAEYTNALDARKKEKNAQWRRAKKERDADSQNKESFSGEDVEMGGVTANESQ